MIQLTRRGLVADDVFTTLSGPAEIDFRAIRLRVRLLADAPFGHVVVFTPPGQPFFCVENQTCSTDAINLHADARMTLGRLLAPHANEEAQEHLAVALRLYEQKGNELASRALRSALTRR